MIIHACCCWGTEIDKIEISRWIDCVFCDIDKYIWSIIYQLYKNIIYIY